MTTSKTIHLFIPGNPVPQGRPRACIRGKHASVYEDAKSKDWKRTVRFLANVGLPDMWELIAGAINLQITFKLLRPKSVSVKKRPEPICRPDLDNLIKAVKDALTGVLWYDDSQIIELEAKKVYDNPPGVDITVWF
jgi:Holliday junction resolvase RusA-like endonuclease